MRIGTRFSVGTGIYILRYDNKMHDRAFYTVYHNRLYAFSHYYDEIMEILPNSSTIMADDDFKHNLNNIQWTEDKNNVMYYNALIDTMYDVIAWLINQDNFYRFYLTADKRIIIDYRENGLENWFVVIQGDIIKKMYFINHTPIFVNLDIVKNGFFLLYHNPFICAGVKYKHADEHAQMLMGTKSTVYGTSCKKITATEIKKILSYGMKLTQGLIDVSVVCVD